MSEQEALSAAFVDIAAKGWSTLQHGDFEAGWKAALEWARGQQPVAYLDIGAGGYLDIGSDLTDDQLQTLPKGRHALGIIGTWGIDGYTSPPQQPAPAQPVRLTEEELEECGKLAGQSYRRHTLAGVRGQMILPQDSFDWHMTQAIMDAMLAKGVEQPAVVQQPTPPDLAELVGLINQTCSYLTDNSKARTNVTDQELAKQLRAVVAKHGGGV